VPHAIVFIFRPGFKQAQLLKLKLIQSVFIDNIVKDSRNKISFVITLLMVMLTMYQLHNIDDTEFQL